jgi:hypothetical protein
LEQIEDQKNWKHLRKEDLERLRQKYNVSWVVLEQPGPPEHGHAKHDLAEHGLADRSPARLECPYENSAVRVCRVD